MKQPIIVLFLAWLLMEMSFGASTPTPTPTPKAKRPFITWVAPKTPQPTPTKRKLKAASSPTVTPKPTKIDTKNTVKAQPKSSPTPTATVKKENARPTDAVPLAAQTSVSPRPEKSVVNITFTKFEPMRGEPGEPNYSNARLTYQIKVSGSENINFPTIHFSIEGSQKLFARHFVPPAGTSPLQPGESFQRIVSLDPTFEGEWSDAYEKTDKAKFSWSIEGQPGESVEMPLHKPWP
jgi:hypothetical protein